MKKIKSNAVTVIIFNKGPGGTLDNRKRTLILASASTNRSHIYVKRADASIPVGVYYYPKLSLPYLAQISFDGHHYSLYFYKTKEEASECYQDVQSQRDKVLNGLRKMTSIVDKYRYIRSFVINHPDLKENTSQYTGVSWDDSNNKWKSAIKFTIKNVITYVTLGYFDDELKASYLRDQLKANAKEIKRRIAGIESSSERIAIAREYIPKHIEVETN
jgi:hypothetical protein